MTAASEAKRRYVYSDVDRHGTRRWYFRRSGMPKVRLPSPSSKGFNTAYLAALSGSPLTRSRRETFVLVREKTGFVYFLRTGSSVKIGYSKSPFSRVRGVSTGISGPIDTVVMVPGSKTLEREIHKALIASRLKGEWFRMDQNVTRLMSQAAAYGHIKNICDPPNPPMSFCGTKTG